MALPTNFSILKSKVTPSPSAPASKGGLYDNNPYSNQDYYKSPWQDMLSAIGFRTGADAWRENMGVQAAEYDAAIAQKLRDEEYNLPINQVHRMRAAGINPDLDGGADVDPGSAAPMPEDPSTPMQSTGDEGTLMSVANGVLGAFSTALGMVGSIQGIQRNHLMNTLQSIENEDAFAKFASGLSGVLLPESPNSDGIQNFDWKSVALKNAEAFANKQLPKKMRQKFIDFQEQYWSSAIGQNESYEDFRKRVNSRKGYFIDSKVNYSEIDDVLSQIVEPLAEMQEKIFAQSQKTELAEGEAAEAGAKTEKEYQENLDGSLMGQAQNSANRSAAASDSTEAIINETINGIVKSLKKTSQDGGLKGALSGIAMAFISCMFLYTKSGIHPSVSRSQSYNPSTGSTSQSRSLSF